MGEELNNLLNLFIENNVQFRHDRKKEALKFWQPIVEEILDYVETEDNRFASLQTFYHGSYYDRTKVKEPNEFDLMLVMGKLELDDEPYDEEDGFPDPPIGFTTVMIDQGEEAKWKRNGCVNDQGMLNATEVKAVFIKLVRSAIEANGYNYKRNCKVIVKSHGPAVTLVITVGQERDSREYSIDLTLAIKDKSWPEDAEEWRARYQKGWPSRELVQEICQDGCHLVAKQPKGSNFPENKKPFLWKYSFTAAAKELLREASFCRKPVLRIVKALREERNLEPLKSYHLKTVLLYECEAKPDDYQWDSTCLGDRFLDHLRRLQKCLESKNCPDYFLRDYNLFEKLDPQKCKELAGIVKKIISEPVKELKKLIKENAQESAPMYYMV